jgi:hypothetical protein
MGIEWKRNERGKRKEDEWRDVKKSKENEREEAERMGLWRMRERKLKKEL